MHYKQRLIFNWRSVELAVQFFMTWESLLSRNWSHSAVASVTLVYFVLVKLEWFQSSDLMSHHCLLCSLTRKALILSRLWITCNQWGASILFKLSVCFNRSSLLYSHQHWYTITSRISFGWFLCEGKKIWINWSCYLISICACLTHK